MAGILKRPSLLFWSLQIGGILSTWFHPLVPIVLATIAVTVVAFLYLNQIFLLLLAHVGIFKGLFESLPFGQIIDLSVLLAVLSLVAIGWCTLQPESRRVFSNNQDVILAYLLWVLWMVAASGYAPSAAGAVYKGLRFASFNTVLFLGPLAMITSRRDSRVMLYLFLSLGILGLFSISLGLYGWLQSASLPQLMVRLSIMGADPIGTARVLVVCAGMCAILPLAGMGKNKRWIALMVIFLVAAMFSGSRGPLASFVIAIGIVGMILPGRTRIRTIGLFVILAILFIVTMMLAPEGLVSRLKLFAGKEIVFSQSGIYAVSTVLHRFELWKMALAVWLNNPIHFLFGMGSAGYAQLFSWRDFTYPHNMPLELLAEFGILGAGIFSIHVILVLRKVWARYRLGLGKEELMWLMGLFIYFVSTMFSGDLNSNRLFWFLLAGLLATVTAPHDAQIGTTLVPRGAVPPDGISAEQFTSAT